MIRESVAGGTAYVCVARSTSVPSATKALAAVDVPTHLVGWISQPKAWRLRIIRWADSTASPAEPAAKIRSSRYPMRSFP
jgi:hypothetical protein